jgi:type IX secretion system PorP/SprF family membrane protein
MRYGKIILLILILSFAVGIVYSQAPVFSQYYASGLYLNPALAGLEKDTYLGINYRSQWDKLGLPFKTFQFSFIQPVSKPGLRKKHLGGYGLSLLNDEAGPNAEFITRGISLAFAHNFHLNRYGNSIVAAAVQAGANQQKVNYDGLRWSSQYSSLTGFDQSLVGEPGLINDQVFYPLLNAGLMWYYTNKQQNLSHFSTSLYSGLSVSHLLPSNSFYLHNEKYASPIVKAHGGLYTTWSRKLDLSPNFLVQLQDHNIQVNIGMYAGYSITNPGISAKTSSTKVLVGFWYRFQDAVIISTGISNANWNIGFSYDSNVFSLSRTFGYGSAYELSLAYKIVSKNGFKRFSSPLI